MSNEIKPSETSGRGLIFVTIVYLLFLAAWCWTYGVTQ